VCGDLRQDNTLTVEGDLLIAGSTTTASPLHVVGSLYSRGSIDARNTQQIGGSLFTDGDWRTSAPVEVADDATVSGTLQADNTVAVGGMLRAAGQNGSGQVSASGVGPPIPFVSPIDCGVVASPNLARNPILPSEALVHLTVPTDLTLGCGTYRFSSLTADNTLRLRVTGRTMIQIDGDVRIASPTVIDVAPGASLVLFVGGALAVDNTLDIGRADVRVAGQIRIAAPLHLAGSLYAPTSSVAADNTIDISGAATVGALRVASPFVLHATALPTCQ